MNRISGWLIVMIAAGGALALTAGCDDTPTKPGMTMRERQDRALSDPMNYKPDFSNDHVSSGGIGDTDKAGLKKDMDHVFNP